MTQVSPLHQMHLNAGALLTENYGWLLPASFGNVAGEYATLRTAAGLIDLSHRSKVVLRGKDRASFLHNFCTNDILKTPSGSGCEAFLTNHQAKILAWLQINVAAEEISLHAEPNLASKLIAYLGRYLITEEVEFSDRTTHEALLLVTGPAVTARLPMLAGWQPRQHQRLTIENLAVQAACTAIYGQPSYFLSVGSEDAAKLWEYLRTQEFQPVGLEAYEILRLEAGVPAYGQDIDETNLPQEMDRTEQAISFTKGCYVGQETIARIRAFGHVNRLFRKLVLGVKVAESLVGAKLHRQGQEVGQVTSASFSPHRGTTLALGYLRRGHQEPGIEVEVVTANGTWAARVEAASPLPA